MQGRSLSCPPSRWARPSCGAADPRADAATAGRVARRDPPLAAFADLRMNLRIEEVEIEIEQER